MRDGRIASFRKNCCADASKLMLAAVVGLFASAGIFAAMQHMGQLRAENRFLQLADQRLSTVRTNVTGALDTIALLASHFQASPGGTSRAEFATLVRPALASHRYLQALEWIPRVDCSERAEYEQRARADGWGNFAFRETRSDGTLRVAAVRDQYFPVFYVEPVAGNERAVGYDLATNAARRTALVQAGETGRIAATARVRLVQEKGDQWGTLLFAPVYRDKSVVGYALSVIRIGDLISGVDYETGATAPTPLVDVYLFDLSASAQERQLYSGNGAAGPENLSQGLHAEKRFEVGGRTWLLVAKPGAAFVEHQSQIESAMAAAFALLLTGIYLRYLKSRMAQSGQISKAAAELGLAQAELKQTNEMLGAVIQSSPLGVVVMDIEGRIQIWNPAAERLHGWAREEVLGRHLPVVVVNSPGEPERVHHAILYEGRATGLEYVCLTKDGNPITVNLSGAPIHNGAGELRGAVYLVMDVTEQKRLERQLAQAQKLESIGQLAAGVAHEINTPMQYIADNLHFLKESIESLLHFWGKRQGDLEAVAREADVDYLWQEMPRAVEQSLEGAQQVARIVGAMKEFSHCGAVSKAAVDLNHAIENTILVSRNEWKYVAEVESHLDSDLSSVQCIPGEVNQVLLNLIVNAAHAIGDVERPVGVKGKITISTRREGSWAEIRVQDTGTGIPEAVRGSIFNPFFTTKSVGKGTGQGLAIAHSVVVQKHGGSITFETEMGVGTTFVVRLPLDDAAEDHGLWGEPALEAQVQSGK
ncbi:MAG TPA: CHASE domain-containing protein [Bryobacteraceae bacterium]|nr:CHASE domain-containing protein [Bryobacteraceae bacterium]